MAVGRDSDDVEKFTTLFPKVKVCCDDSPETLLEDAVCGQAVRSLYGELSFAAILMKYSELRSRNLIAPPVDPGFISAWRGAFCAVESWFRLR